MRFPLLHLAILLATITHAPASALLDILVLGDPVSEKNHALTSEKCEVASGAQGRKMRRLLPPATPHWEGGNLSFDVAVDPSQQNYLTLRLWAADTTPNRLILFCEGKQVGYRHLGDVDLLDTGSDEPGRPGQFLDRTTPLPENITKGKNTVRCEIRANGRIWGYGTNFEQYQKPMTEPSRGLYIVATHTNGFFDPPVTGAPASVPGTPTIRTTPGIEVLDEVKARVRREIDGMLRSNKPLGQLQIHLLARSWHVAWTQAHNNPQTITQVATSLDTLWAKHLAQPDFYKADPAVYNSDWFGYGLAGDTIRLLEAPLKPLLDKTVPDGKGGAISRREAWGNMLLASREWLRSHRRAYTNQSMIVDMNLYRANGGLRVVLPHLAFTEEESLRYLHEAIGVRPWLGSDTPQGPLKPLGNSYMQTTRKGLTRELGYVGYYGEVLDWVTAIYDSTRMPGMAGDPVIRNQLIKLAHARAVFRYPSVDPEGNQAFRIEAVVGWRDDHFPGDVTYGQRDTRDCSSLGVAATILDPASVGRVQQMMADNQFFITVKERLKEPGIRNTAGLLDIPDQYHLLNSQAPQPHRLPMSSGEPDFAWSDEENGVVAIKSEGEILYISLYWRARYAINSLARVHYITPNREQIAVVKEETQFRHSGLFWTRPNWTNMAFGNGGLKYPNAPQSAHQGEKLPIAQIPLDLNFKSGQESIYAGKASFYQLQYGPYMVAMNTTSDQSFEVEIPLDFQNSVNLNTGEKIAEKNKILVPHASTIILKNKREK